MEHLILRKVDLIDAVSRVTELSLKGSAVIVELVLGNIAKSLKSGERVEIRGFGSFSVRQRRGRIGRNPKTGAQVVVPPKKIVSFKASQELRDRVDHKKAGLSTGGIRHP